jgi:membrane protein DedA with SNARE-associated domain
VTAGSSEAAERSYDSVAMDLGAFAASYGVLAIFMVMLLKEAGIPVPVPSDLIMVGAGVQLVAGAYSPLALFIALAAATLIGSSVQFLIARSAGRAVVYRLAGMVGIGTDRLDQAVARLATGGSRAVFVGLNIPGARAAVIPAAGLARLAFAPFLVATLAGSGVFYGWHVALGYIVGPPAFALLERYSGAVLGVLALLAVAGLAGWLWIRRRRRGALRSWADAACPACLAISSVASR